METMDDKNLKEIAKQLQKMNAKLDNLINTLSVARNNLISSDEPKIGSTGEFNNKQSEK